MKIKEVTLDGFRSFDHNFVLTVIEDGSNANVVFIGCRKPMLELFKVLSLALSFSNDPDPFFDAELIGNDSATVKITFTQNEASEGFSQITLERTITRAKVSNKLDGNAVERIEFVHFLELIEFSRSHPYTFHIQMDDIERFTRSNGAHTAFDRWKILQKLIGTEEFMQSAAKAKRILNETENEIHCIESLLRKINGQFEIFVANETPVAYKMLSVRKLSLEQCYRAKQIAVTRESIGKCTVEIERLEKKCSQLEQNLHQDELQAAQNRVKKAQLDQSIAQESSKRRNLFASISEMKRIGNMLSERVTSGRSRLQADELVVSFAENEKSTVSQTLEEKQHDLQVLTVDYNRLTERSNELCQQMVPLEQCCQQLMMNAAQNVRMNWKFCTEEDRNAWIDAELQSLAKEMKRKESHLKRINTEYETKQQMFIEKKTQLKETSAKQEECGGYGAMQEKDLEEDVLQLNRKRDAALKNRQIVLEQIDKQHAMNLQLEQKHNKIENELMEIIGKSLFQGLKSLEALLHSEKCSPELRRSFHGLVIDGLKHENSNNDPAVGALAGPRLFHHIVDDAGVATQFIRLFNENQFPGEIFFITLDEINNLLDFEKAVPPDPFYGEFHDSFISCIPPYRERTSLIGMQTTWAHELRTLDYKLDSLNRCVETTEQEIQASRNLYEHFKRDMNEIKLLSVALNDLEAKVKTKATKKAKIAKELNTLKQRKLQLEAERKVALLMPDEQAAVDDVRRQIDAIAIVYRQNMNAMNQVRTRRSNLNHFIETHLKPKQRDLDEVSMSYITQTELLERDSSELEDTTAAINESETELTALDKRMEQLNHDSAKISAELQQHRKRKKDVSAEFNADAEEKIRLMTERNRLNAELAKLGDDLTSAMPLVDESIAALTITELEQELEEVNHQLRVFKETNHFDVDRVENFKSEEERLSQRLAVLKKNGIELRRLIATKNVENKKATCEMMAELQTTFVYLFHRIIDTEGCSGHLELRSMDAVSNENDPDQELEIYCTFSCDVSSENDLPFDQLSLNHKTIVALIFILAVLQSSPYAVYLLDHIDEDIAEPYRRNIAEYIEERSNVSQFFVAASHTEMLSTPANVFEFMPSMPGQHVIMKRIRPIDSNSTKVESSMGV